MERVPIAHHPGRFLARALEERNWTQSFFANLIEKTDTELSQLITGKRNITLDRAMRIAAVFDTDEEFWLKMQIAYDRYQRYQKKQNQEITSLIKARTKELVFA